MNALRRFTVTLQDMRNLGQKNVTMFAVSQQAAADGARGRQDSPADYAVIRTTSN